MMLLTSTSDILRIVTGAAVSTIGVHASWVDNASGTITPGRTNTAITTATTTTVVAAPAASTQRNVKLLTISNNHATLSTLITVQHFDGTTSVDLESLVLNPQESLIFTEEGWFHYDAQGAKYAHDGPLATNLGINGTLAETFPREQVDEASNTAGASGSLYMQAIYLKAGTLVSNISIHSAAGGATTPTNYYFALYDGSRNLLANSANQTTTAWLAQTLKTLAMTTPYRVITSGIYYIGFYMTAASVANVKGQATRGATQLSGQAPILNGISSTGLTTTLPNPAAAITVNTSSMWAAVT